MDNAAPVLNYRKLRPGDRVCFVSPASTPDRDVLFRRVRALQDVGLKVEFAPHAFAEHGWFAGTDEEQLDAHCRTLVVSY